MDKRILVLLAIIIGASTVRLFFSYITFDTTWSNFSPLPSIILFLVTYLSRQKDKILCAILLFLFSDYLVNFFIYNTNTIWYSSIWGNILALLFIVWVSVYFLQKISLGNIVIAGVLISLGHYFFSDLAVWLSGSMYPLTIEGFVACYTAAIPFLKNTLISNLAYSIIFFFCYQWYNEKNAFGFFSPKSNKQYFV